MIDRMRSTTLRTALLGLYLVAMTGCASLEARDEREDIHNTLKSDMKACGTDTRCMQKREAAESRARGTPAAP